MEDKKARFEFEVKPVGAYNGARYPSPHARLAPVAREESGKVRPGLMTFALALILIVGLSLGVLGCFAEYKNDPCALGYSLQPNGSCGPDPDPECDPGALRCDGSLLEACNAEGSAWTGQECEDYCDAMYDIDAYSTGCDAEADDPCGCEYDIIDGDIADCNPGDFYCQDEQTVAICNDNRWSWDEQNCNTYCEETYGYGYVSYGCDSDAEEPCDCIYDIMDGVVAECTPGDAQYCQDDETLWVCADDRYSFEQKDCQLWCEEEFGEDYWSTTCDMSDVDNPCGCEYGIVDGEPVDP